MIPKPLFFFKSFNEFMLFKTKSYEFFKFCPLKHSQQQKQTVCYVIEEDFNALAKAAILGHPPSNAKACVGHAMARLYFEPYIEQAEPVLQNLAPPRDDLKIILHNAFQYKFYKSFLLMPLETRREIENCCNRFCERYGVLMNDQMLKAA